MLHLIHFIKADKLIGHKQTEKDIKYLAVNTVFA